MTIYWDLVERRASNTPDELVVADDSGARLTASALCGRAERLAFRLAARGIAPGDRDSWILPSSADAVVLICALARLGAVQNPIVPIYGEHEVGCITSQVGTKLLVTPGTFRTVDFTAVGRAVGPRGLRSRRAVRTRRRTGAGRAGAHRRRCGALGVRDVGHHRRPEVRAALGPHDGRGRVCDRAVWLARRVAVGWRDPDLAHRRAHSAGPGFRRGRVHALHPGLRPGRELRDAARLGLRRGCRRRRAGHRDLGIPTWAR
jgi:hypothetical protein